MNGPALWSRRNELPELGDDEANEAGYAVFLRICYRSIYWEEPEEKYVET